MAKSEMVCPKHGPYAAYLGSCPVCNSPGGRPKAPPPLDEEDAITTDLGNGRIPGNYSDSTQDLDDLPTDIPRGHGKRGLVNLDDEITSLGHHGDLDHTVIKSKDKKPQAVEVIFWQRNGNRRGKILQIKNQDTIGRTITCNHSLDGDGVSGQHAKVTLDEGQYYIWDLGSSNGTFVNGQQIYGRTPLKENDIVGIDDFEFVVKMLS